MSTTDSGSTKRIDRVYRISTLSSMLRRIYLRSLRAAIYGRKCSQSTDVTELTSIEQEELVEMMEWTESAKESLDTVRNMLQRIAKTKGLRGISAGN